MNDVTVNIRTLVAILKENRDKHNATFEKALTVYREAAIKLLEESIAAARRGDKIIRYISIPEPEEHTKDYDRVIGLLELSVDDKIDLAEHEYSQYVLDEWGWQQTFLTNTTSYAMQNP